MLFVFFVLLGIGLVFYSAAEQKSSRLQQDESAQLLLIERALRVAQLPELECPTSLEARACVDLIKAEKADELFRSNQAAYFDLFGFGKITLQVLGRGQRNVYAIGITYQLYDYHGDRTSQRQVRVPVSVYDPVGKTYAFGVLELAVFT